MRDQANLKQLEMSGWRVLTIWECQLRNLEDTAASIRTFLTETPSRKSF